MLIRSIIKLSKVYLTLCIPMRQRNWCYKKKILHYFIHNRVRVYSMLITNARLVCYGFFQGLHVTACKNEAVWVCCASITIKNQLEQTILISNTLHAECYSIKRCYLRAYIYYSYDNWLSDRTYCLDISLQSHVRGLGLCRIWICFICYGLLSTIYHAINFMYALLIKL